MSIASNKGLGILALLSFLPCGAYSEEVVFSGSTTVTLTDLDWAAQEQDGVFASINLPEFDPTLGELTSVVLETTGRFAARGRYQFGFVGTATTPVAVNLGILFGVAAGEVTISEFENLVTDFGSFDGDVTVPCCEQVAIDFERVDWPDDFGGSQAMIFETTDSNFDQLDFIDISITRLFSIQNFTPGLVSTADELYEFTFAAEVTYSFVPVPEPGGGLLIGAVAVSIGVWMGQRR
ncbi:MAG: choice-of-anchor E domain-containing protein [Planctomycetota bacterium]